MIFNPFEREEQTGNQSKSKAFAQTLIPMSNKQLNCLLARREDFTALGRVVLVGRVVRLK